MKKKYMILLSALSLASSTFAQTWIWYPGDYEIWLGNQMNNRRTERGAFFPPFWKTDSHYVVVEFSKQLNLSERAGRNFYCCRRKVQRQTGWKAPVRYAGNHVASGRKT